MCFVDEKGRKRGLVVKGNDDLRKDSRLIALYRLFDDLGGKCSEVYNYVHNDYNYNYNDGCSDYNNGYNNINNNNIIDTYIYYNDTITNNNNKNNTFKQYVVIPYTPTLGTIEYIDNLITLKEILLVGENKKVMIEILKKYKKRIKTRREYTEWNSRVKNVLKDWYRDTYKNNYIYYKSKINYTISLGRGSALGYLIGLGDRHLENIMIAIKDGIIVHIDLNLLFDKGKELIIPEKVPFRLTKNLYNNLTILKENGLFFNSFININNTVIKRKELFEAYLLSFTYDPVNEVKRPRMVIDRLFTRASKNELDVKKVIGDAMDSKNIFGMFIGWMGVL